jgi:HAD superfamily hydrolase (TIGR01549 family)
VFVFFDVGDTLVDERAFGRLRTDSLYRFLTERGLAITREAYDSALDNLSTQARLSLFGQLDWLARSAGGDTLLAMAVFRDYMLQVAPQAPEVYRPFPDARTCLWTLAEPAPGAPRYRLGIIANQPTWIRARLADWGLLQHCVPEAVVISDEVGVGKPSPEIFAFALQQAGVGAAEAVMVGNDYAGDIEPASRLGMRTIWVDREGLAASGAHPAANACVRELAEVPPILATWAA